MDSESKTIGLEMEDYCFWNTRAVTAPKKGAILPILF